MNLSSFLLEKLAIRKIHFFRDAYYERKCSKMKTRKLGRSGIEVSALGMGCAALGGPFFDQSGSLNGYGDINAKDGIRAIQKGLELGVTLFDTSDIYGCGRSEQILGEAIKGKRNEVVLSTKFGVVWNKDSKRSSTHCQAVGVNITPEFIQKACIESLKRLQTDYIDIYQLHINKMNTKEAPKVMETLEKLVEEGLIRFYGWSTDDPERAMVFAKGKHCTTVQFKHNMTFHNKRMLEKVVNKMKIAGLIKGPLGSGILTGKYKDDSKLPQNHLLHGIKFDKGRIAEIRAILEEVRDILTSDGRTLAQAALGWIWAENSNIIPIPGFTSVEQVEENVKAMQFGPLSRNQLNEINEFFRNLDTNLKNGYFL